MKIYIFFMLLLAGFTAAADETPCDDVGVYDFKNSVLSVKDDTALAVNPADSDALPFKNGACELKDDPGSAKSDWRYEIVGDFLMRPTKQVKVRVLRIFENHLSGSGSWDRLMAFKCKTGRLEKIWQKRFSESLKVKRINELQFKVRAAAKKKIKSRNSDLGVYQWDNTHGTFKQKK